VTAHPSAEWIARQLTEACGWERPPRYIVRDFAAAICSFVPGRCDNELNRSKYLDGHCRGWLPHTTRAALTGVCAENLIHVGGVRESAILAA